MKSTAEEIASLWREQMKRGYLKLAILFVLTKNPSHGYRMVKDIQEFTLGLLTPTVGAVYPALNELEKDKLVKGMWKEKGKKKVKVYEITRKGREVFRKAVEKHLNLVSATQNMILKELETLGIMKQNEPSPRVYMQAVKLLLLNDKAGKDEKIEALEKLKDGCCQLKEALGIMIENIEKRIDDLQSSHKNTDNNAQHVIANCE